MSNIEGLLKKEFEYFTGISHCIFVNSGSSALELALHALQLPKNSEILVPSIGCDAITMSVILSGLKPLYYEVGDVLETKVDEDLCKRASAIILVYPFGMVVPGVTPSDIMTYKKFGLKVIADCAQAFETFIDGRHVGQYADATVFSFADGKMLECGEGGALLSNCYEYIQRAECFSNSGRIQGTYDRRLVGRNLRMARPVLSELKKSFDGWPINRRERLHRATIWKTLLQDTQGEIITPLPFTHMVPYKLVVRFNEQDFTKIETFQNWVRTSQTIQTWWPLLPLEKLYAVSYSRTWGSVNNWKKHGLMLRVSSDLPVSVIEQEARDFIKLFIR
ncbi:L-glutamine:scyllo-inosose aminotransferase [Chlamydia abortus]|nr:L-glutamine:scyllo-inosose aminotransferase [Chlamydia abortus]